MIGILALQGGYDAHQRHLKALGLPSRFVQGPADLEGLRGLILPGGESTTIGKLLVIQNLMEPLRARLAGGLPAFGTCAGMILLADTILGYEAQSHLGGLDIAVTRNAYGRQLESFETRLPAALPEPLEIPALFIRAPRIERQGSGVQVLGSYEGIPVLVRQKHLMAASFHPELTDDTHVHAYFARELCGLL